MQLRPYQAEAIDAVESDWAAGHNAVLVASPTGTGKTEMFIEIIRRGRAEGRRVLVLCNMLELVSQTADRIRRRIGVMPDIEQAGFRASTAAFSRAPVVVASVQSLVSGPEDNNLRVHRFDPREFGVIIADEAHLTITRTYDTILSHFAKNPDIRIAGFTATPKRQDGRSLAQRYPKVSYDMRLADAIHGGWLVPVKGKVVPIESVSIKGLSTTSSTGDFSANAVGELMEGEDTVLGVAHTLLDLCEDKRTLVFTARVRHAKLMTAELNKQKPGCAAFVTGETDDQTRKHIIDSFRNGDIQYLLNCAVLTTGFDAPEIEVVANLRPTKSWALFAQMVGRGTRPLPGIIDTPETPEARRAAIAASDKPHMTVYSFVGREGSHELVGPEDILSGHMDPPGVLTRAKEILNDDEGERDIEEALDQARDEERIREEKQAEIANATVDGVDYKVLDTDFFDKNEHVRMALKSEIALPEHLSRPFLVGAGYSKRDVDKWSDDRCKAAVNMLQDRERRGLCTLKQANQIRRMYTRIPDNRVRNMTKNEASKLIGQAFNKKKKAKGVLA